MEAETLDLIVRSRPTILEILEDRGYNMEAYKGASPETLQKFATTSAELLKIQAEHENGTRVSVLYWVEGACRLRLEHELRALWSDENPNHFDITKDEIIIILSETFHDAFHLHAAKQWNTLKARVTFFHLKNLISNPSKHTFVPPHRKLSPAEITSVVASLHMKSKSEFPHIKYHIDIQARVHGLVPGDVVEIRRPSETAGEYTTYRVCTI
jgi:DNA-directed RNA polymerase subunit H (RpoH/RPB5)